MIKIVITGATDYIGSYVHSTRLIVMFSFSWVFLDNFGSMPEVLSLGD